VLGEFVSMMERNPNYSMKILHELCESQFYKEINRKISREQKVEDGKRIFDVG
jgi:hypothetical protein